MPTNEWLSAIRELPTPELGAPLHRLVNALSFCTDKDHALVEYATASMDNHLFVSKYAVELPSKAQLEKFLHAKHLEMLGEA
jgi:hypothetical protein